MSISNSAMLVEMNVSVWTAQRVDRTVTKKTTDDASATSDAGLFRKNLMAGSTLRKDIADYAALCRTWHVGKTMPWSDKGVRLLPTSMFLEYKKEVNDRRNLFNSRVAEFLQEYPNLVGVAQQNLGSMFDQSEYPSPAEVASKFDFKLVFSPVPEAGDFRLDINTSELEELKQQWDEAANNRIEDAMQSAWDRLHTMLVGMSEKLTEPEGEGSKIFHSTFVTNATDLCDLLGHLNITKCPDLEYARSELEKAIAHVDILDIRKNEDVRADVKAQVDSVLAEFEW